MQLKANNLRGALALASYTVLNGTASGDPLADRWQVESAVLFYSEKDRVNVTEPAVMGTRNINDGESITFRGIVDSMSGATPNGAVPSNQPQTYTTPSGNTNTIPAGTMSTSSFSDTRVAFGMDWNKELSRLTKQILSTNISTEKDYFSLGGSATYTFDTENRMTTFSAGLGYSYDQVIPIGGKPAALTSLSTAPTGSDSSSSGFGLNGELKTTGDVLLGVTRVLSRRALTQLNYTVSATNGYLNDPYKVLSLVDNNGVSVDQVYEKRPDSRNSSALYWLFVYHLPEDVIHLSYRFYKDDWGVHSSTYNLDYRYQLGKRSYIKPHLRYYTQTAADFYHLYLMNGDPLPDYASADYRLAAFKGTNIGIKYGHTLGRHSEFSLRAELMQQTGDSHPSDAVGVLSQYDLYPGLDATIFQVNYSVNF